MAHSPIQSQRLIGRAADVQHARRAMDAAGRGQGQVLLISGEAGIGKSRLIAEIKAAMAEARHGQSSAPAPLLCEGRCFEQDRALPYAPLIDLLRTQTSQIAEDLRGLSPLSHLLPELGEAPAPSEPEQDKRRLFEALAQTLGSNPSPKKGGELAAIVVIVVIIEDLHWADEASLEFLLYFARRIGSRPVLLAMTYRGDEVGLALERFLAALDRERLATEIELKRLDANETASLIRSVFDLPHSPQPEFLSAIHQLTDGNPFFVEEVLKSFVSAGEIFELGGQWGRKPLSQLRVPRTVQAAVRQRSVAVNLRQLKQQLEQRRLQFA